MVTAKQPKDIILVVIKAHHIFLHTILQIKRYCNENFI